MGEEDKKLDTNLKIYQQYQQFITYDNATFLMAHKVYIISGLTINALCLLDVIGGNYVSNISEGFCDVVYHREGKSKVNFPYPLCLN